MNEKELNNDLQEVKFEDIKTEEVKEETSEKKKHSNAKVVFRLLICAFVLGFGFILLSGGYHPFKSNKVALTAEEAAEKAIETQRDIGLEVFEGILTEEEFKHDKDYGENSTAPYGFSVDESDSLKKDGILKEVIAVNAGFSEKYSSTLAIWYMKNIEYADEKFAFEKSQWLAQDKKMKNGKIAIGKENKDMYIIVQKSTVVYFMWADDNVKAQALLDKLNIEYKL